MTNSLNDTHEDTYEAMPLGARAYASRLAWRTAQKGDIRCDGCQASAITYSGNGGTNNVYCNTLKAKTKANTTCDASRRDSGLGNPNPKGTEMTDTTDLTTTEGRDLVLYDRHRIVSECKFYMGQSAEAMLEAGKRLIDLKDNEPHGEFERIVEQELGMAARTARVMMQAALKFMSPQLDPKRQALAVLGKTKMLELMAESDDDLVELADGGKLHGMALDDIARMTSREVSAAFRKHKADTAEEIKKLKAEMDAKDRKLKSRAEEISDLKDQLDDKKERQINEDPQAIARDGYIKDLLDEAVNLRAGVNSSLRQRCLAVFDAHDLGIHDEHARMVVAKAIGLVAHIARTVAIDMGINPNDLPELTMQEAIHGEGAAGWQVVNEAMKAQEQGNG